MYQHHRLTPALLLLAVLFLAGPGQIRANTDPALAAAGHLIEGENALQAGDYLKAATEYRKAAQLSDQVDVARNATEIAMRLGFNDQALLSVTRWLELDEDNEEAKVYYAQLQLRQGNIRESRRTIEKLIDTGDGKDDQRLLSLLPILSDEDPQAADRLMRELAKPYPDSAPANYATAVMALQAGDAEYAMQKSARASELEPTWLKPKLVFGRAQLLQGDRNKAIDYMERIIGDSQDPDPDARLELALMYMSADRVDDAMSQVNQILLEQPDRADALRLMAIINFRQNNLDAAQADFEDLLSTGQFTTDALYYLARIADVRNDFEQAAQLYMQVRDGQNAVIAQRRAAALTAIQLGEPEDALYQLEKFGERYPQYAVDMVLAKAQLLTALERYDEALDFYNQARKFRPEDEDTALGRAALLLRMDRLKDAINAYRVALHRFPDSAQLMNALGYTLVDRTDDYEEAEKLIRKAIKLEPESPAIIDSLGWLLYKQGRFSEALEQLQIAYSRFPDPEVAAHLVEVLAELDRNDDALALLEQSERQNPQNPLLRGVRERRFPDTLESTPGE
ncbi:MAG: tetratricopeptide repeat protein [Gammaproteobacteria bacterium]|nr:tetratricopeptide repeat protein [Gammaproteobacteria bacterium]